MGALFARGTYFCSDTLPLDRCRPARLEGVTLDEPHADGQPLPAHGIAAIEAAQAGGHVDPAWPAIDLLVLLFAIGLAWAQLPHPDAVTQDAAVIAQRRAAAVDAARRITSR